METASVIGLAVGVVVILWLVASLNSVKVYRFHRPSCPYCVESEPEWKKFKGKCMFRLIKPIDINISNATKDELALYKNMGLNSVPSVMAVYPNGYRKKHSGERTSNSYMEWLNSNEVVE